MSEERTARDPFVGLNRLIERRAEETQRSWYAIGKVLSVSPLKIRADGMDLDWEDLRVPESLFPNFAPTAQGRGIQAVLPEKVLTGYCEIWVNGGLVRGDAYVTRPAETVQSKVPLAAGDEVLLLRSGDAQTYYLIERMVKL